MLYRGSEHGFTASDFHARCDNKGPTVTLVLNDIDKCFGGFTMLDWDKSDSAKTNTDDFVFSLDKNERYDYQNKHSI